ncbi:MAG TPA: dihydrofolate reductase family protein [Ktedonobacteraceae bacterium]|jgi:hypothetical protein
MHSLTYNERINPYDEIGSIIPWAFRCFETSCAAGDKQVTVVGGANTAQQCLQAELVDEIHMGIVPVLFGESLRFFEPLVYEQVELERTRIFESQTRTELRYSEEKQRGIKHKRNVFPFSYCRGFTKVVYESNSWRISPR